MIENNDWKLTSVDQHLISRQRTTSTGNERVYVLRVVCYSLPALFNCNPHLVIHILDHLPGNHLIYVYDCATLSRLRYHQTVGSDIIPESAIRSHCGATMSLSFISCLRYNFDF